MLPPPRTALATAFGIGVARTVAIGQAGVRRPQLAAVAGALLVPGAAGPRDLAARMDRVGAVVEVQCAAGRGSVLGRTLVALVDAGWGDEVRLPVAGDANL